MSTVPLSLHGRGAAENPPNRFEPLARVPLPDYDPTEDPGPRTQLLRDESQSILTKNDSPDIPFVYHLNPYRGCEHGCIYCYARPTHEYLSFSAGLDFETKILVKEDAPELLRKHLASDKWEPQAVGMSGVTDCYQPAERGLKITRRCLEVFAEYRNPVGIVTKASDEHCPAAQALGFVHGLVFHLLDDAGEIVLPAEGVELEAAEFLAALVAFKDSSSDGALGRVSAWGALKQRGAAYFAKLDALVQPRLVAIEAWHEARA